MYADGDQLKSVRPDFIFFAQLAGGSIVADIVDPYGTQFSDAFPKLKGEPDVEGDLSWIIKFGPVLRPGPADGISSLTALGLDMCAKVHRTVG